MCVIALVQTDEQRLTDEQIGKMHNNNSAGAGIAWFTNDKGGAANILNWKKGLDEDEVKALLPKLPLPYAIHFRNPSPNTSTSPMACHPFIVNAEADPSLSGSILNGALIMHNGFWSQWREKVMDISLVTRSRIPTGVWSDSRGIAFAANAMGAGVLELINEKVLYFSTSLIQTFGTGWSTLPSGLLVSNTTWQTTTVHHGVGHHHNRATGFMQELDARAAAQSQRMNERAGGGAHQGTFRQAHGQAGQETTREGQGQGTATLPRIPSDAGGPAATVHQGRVEQKAIQQEGETVSNRPTQHPQGVSKWSERVKSGTDCQDCAEQAGWVQIGGVRRCWDCWDKIQRKVPAATGTCNVCDKVPTTMIILETGDWVCDPCWKDLGSPPIVRDQDLTGVQRRKIQARRAGGATV